MFLQPIADRLHEPARWHPRFGRAFLALTVLRRECVTGHRQAATVPGLRAPLQAFQVLERGKTPITPAPKKSKHQFTTRISRILPGFFTSDNLTCQKWASLTSICPAHGGMAKRSASERATFALLTRQARSIGRRRHRW